MPLFLQDAGGSAIDTIQSVSSATSTTITAWSSTVQTAFTAPGQTLTAAAISAADVGKTVTIVNTGANSFTLAQTGGSITSAIGLVVNPGATCALKAVNTTTSIIVGTNSSHGTIGEFGSQSFITSAQQILTTTVADLNQSTFTLPSAGTWEVTYTAHTFSVSNANITVYIADTLNNIVANSIGQSNEASASQSFIPITKTVYITTTGSTNYKLRGISTVATTGGILANDAALRSNTISWRKISGFTPATGQSVDYVFARVDSDTAVANNASIPFVTQSGSIPNSGGVFTLSAGKTYKLEGTAPKTATDSASGFAFRWINITNSTTIGYAQSLPPTAAVDNSTSQTAYVIFTPTVTTQVALRNFEGATRTVMGLQTTASIVQLGSTATTGLSLNLTTIGTGASTYNSGTSTLNIPNVINDQTVSGFVDIGNTRIQWGRSTMGAGLTTVNFPAAFTNTTYSITGNTVGGASTTVIQAPTFNALSTTQFTFTLTFINNLGNPPNPNTGASISWIAIGQKP